eukprot:s573_g32.t1
MLKLGKIDISEDEYDESLDQEQREIAERAGEVLEDWWQLIAQTTPGSAQVGLLQWNDACRSLGFHGDSTLTYQLLEEEGNSISWTDFKRLSQFR